MIDLQSLIDAMSAACCEERSKYHLTLGGLIAALKSHPADIPVRFDHGAGVGTAHSDRGYYSDLAFSDAEEIGAAGDLLKEGEAAIGKTYKGYKGGDYTMTAKTPLWNAPYGCTGVAIMAVELNAGELVLTTKNVE